MPPPIYVSIGSNKRFYIEFEDGRAEWYGPEKLADCLEAHCDLEISSVAFGERWDTFFVVFSDGSWDYQGKGIPKELVRLIVHNGGFLSDLICVTLGPQGEWFVATKNGQTWWGGLSDELEKIIYDLLSAPRASDWKPRVVDFIDFGESGSYFLSYE
uniref:Uncharacterized protein n=2 Tax=Ditylum brightwellii TaxID=49249 RepID=A0A7S4SZ66_9STRA